MLFIRPETLLIIWKLAGIFGLSGIFAPPVFIIMIGKLELVRIWQLATLNFKINIGSNDKTR